MKLTELIRAANNHLLTYGDADVLVEYFDPADGETGSLVLDDDVEVISNLSDNPSEFTLCLGTPVSAVLVA